MSVGPRGEYPRLERSDAKGEPPPLRESPLPQASPDGGLSVRLNNAAITIVNTRTGRVEKHIALPPQEGTHTYLAFEGWLKDANLFRCGNAPTDYSREGLPWCDLWVTRLLDPRPSHPLDASPPDPLDGGMFLSDRCEYWTFSTGAGAVALVPGRGNEVDFFDGPSVHAITRLKTGRKADNELGQPVIGWRDSGGMLVLVYGISVPAAVVRIDLERRVVVSAIGPSNDAYEENAFCQSDVEEDGVEYGPRCRTRPPGQ
jgi:hypothetical protein